MIEDGVRQHLLSLPLVTSAVGGRIYHEEIPVTSSRPCIAIEVITGAPDYQIDGEAGLMETNIQVDVFADSPLVVSTIVENIRRGCSGYAGPMGEHHVVRALIEASRTISEQPTSGRNRSVFGRSIEINLLHKAAPAVV